LKGTSLPGASLPGASFPGASFLNGKIEAKKKGDIALRMTRIFLSRTGWQETVIVEIQLSLPS
jgi:hypothetical protein